MTKKILNPGSNLRSFAYTQDDEIKKPPRIIPYPEMNSG